MNKFNLGGINFSFMFFPNVLEKNISKLISEIEKYLNSNSLFLVNSYIFTSYKDNVNILNFSKKYLTNLIYSREENFFNIQILCAYNDGGFQISEINNNNKKVGVILKNKHVDLMFINSLELEYGDFKNQTEGIYDFLFKTIKQYGFNNKNIIKAWNFIEDILLNYKDFNVIRDKYFERELINNLYPAGTGVDCILPFNKKHSSSYFLLKPKSDLIEIETMSSDLQCEAKQYGPKFSRAKLIKSIQDKNDLLFISGTAAVNKKGESLFTEDIDENIKYTFKSIENLLNKSGMNFDDIISSFIYIKNKKFYKNFLNIYKKQGFKFPYIYNFCDICRGDFLFEIECVANKTRNS